jgi:hypothetical protein
VHTERSRIMFQGRINCIRVSLIDTAWEQFIKGFICLAVRKTTTFAVFSFDAKKLQIPLPRSIRNNADLAVHSQWMFSLLYSVFHVQFVMIFFQTGLKRKG